MAEPKLTAHGFEVVPREMTQLGIIRNSSKGTQHFTRVIPIETGTPIRPLCAGNREHHITQYEIVGQVFDLSESQKSLDIDHIEDFCQSCKRQFRRLFGMDFTGSFLTSMFPEAYPGQPVRDRFVIYGSIYREERDGKVELRDDP